MEVAGSRVLLTGASAGIGAALAPLLTARGCSVALVGRRADRLDAVLAGCTPASPSCRAYPVDLASPSAASALAQRVTDDLGGVDILINNAGAPMRRRVQDLSVDELHRTVAVNFES